MRCEDLINRRREVKRVWNPNIDKHRGRLRMEILRDENVNKEGVNLVLKVKPKKTDPAGERGFEKFFVLYRCAHALCAGESLWRILKDHSETGD